jgi:hypothetical protein
VREPAQGLAAVGWMDAAARLAPGEVEPHRAHHGVVGAREPAPLVQWRQRARIGSAYPAAERGHRGAQRRSPQRPREEPRELCGRLCGPAEATRLVEPPVQTVEHVVEEVRAVVMGRHPVGEQHVRDVAGPKPLQMVGDHRVEPPVHLPHGVASQTRGDRGIVPRVRGIVEVPELVPHAMRLAEHVEEEIPAAAVEQIERGAPLALDSLADVFEQGGCLVFRALLA